MDSIEVGNKDIDWMPVAQNRCQGLAPVNKLMTEYSSFIKAGNFLIS
jgi:hypothetical protein